VGCDIDWKVLRGSPGENRQNINFDAHRLPRPDILHADMSPAGLRCWRGVNEGKPTELFDAILTDPPYGMRESHGGIDRSRCDELLSPNVRSSRISKAAKKSKAQLQNNGELTDKPTSSNNTSENTACGKNQMEVIPEEPPSDWLPFVPPRTTISIPILLSS